MGANRHLTIDIVRDLAARDAGGAVCNATGFIEAGEEGSEYVSEIVKWIEMKVKRTQTYEIQWP